jgi:predicted esterase
MTKDPPTDPPAGRSVLVYRRENESLAGTGPPLIVLHGYRARSDQLLSLARSLGWPGPIYAPEAARPAQFMRDEPYGVTIAAGQTWYLFSAVDEIEPATFGDSLAQIELFVRDAVAAATRDQASMPATLIGFDQGAVLALSLGVAAPELVSAVVAIHGFLPSIPALGTLIGRLDGVKVLLINDPASRTVPVRLTEATLARLAAAGAVVASKEVQGAAELPPTLAALIREWRGAETTRPG